MTAPEMARKVSLRAGWLFHHVHVAGRPDSPREAQREALTGAFHEFRAVCRMMAELEALAPNCAEAGYARDAELTEIAETVRGRAA